MTSGARFQLRPISRDHINEAIVMLEAFFRQKGMFDYMEIANRSLGNSHCFTHY